MTKLWVATTGVWGLGLIAFSAFFAAYFSASHEASFLPSLKFVAAVLLLSFAWFVVALIVGFKHPRPARVITLGVPAATFAAMFAVILFTPLKSLSAMGWIDYPPASSAENH